MGCTQIKKTRPLNIKRRERKLSEDTLSIVSDFSSVCQQFKYKRSLGHGKYGRVFLAESAETGQQVAIKAIPLIGSPLPSIKEVEILAEVDHPNVVKFYRHYLSSKYLYVAMEFCEGEELFSEIIRRGHFSEDDTQEIMERLLRVINHCHQLNIIHCDLKPENIMYSPEGTLKVIDFGLSMKLKAASYKGIAGTSHYIAPEIIKSGVYTKACDIWSLGIIMYVMLTGYIPIAGSDFSEVTEHIKNFQKPSFDPKKWKGISGEAKDLITKMLEPNNLLRITAAEALNHPWFASHALNSSATNASFSSEKDILEALRRYSEFSASKKGLLALIVKSVADIELKDYHEMFFELDKEKTGFLSANDLFETLNLTGNDITKEELEELLKKVNHKSETFVSYTEFVSALIATKQFLTEERLRSVYKMLETETQQTKQTALAPI